MGQIGVSYLEQLAPWKGKGGFSLEKVRNIAKKLGDPQDAYPTIHVAGTNGKGSVSVATAAMLAGSGARVGLISSPHLSRLNERIVIDGQMISDEQLSSVALELRSVANGLGTDPTFFEAMVLCGFLAFAKSRVDWGVVEVGLGGRLDATNIIQRPDVAVVSTIDYDHQDILGDTLEKIAAEKAGIFKQGSKVVIGESKEGPRSVLMQHAAALGLTTYIAGRDFSWNAGNINERLVRYESNEFGSFDLTSNFAGVHQAQNIGTAVTAARAAGVSEEICSSALMSAFWPARLERVHFGGRECLLDCAHNPAGIGSLADSLREAKVQGGVLVFGSLETKDWKEMLRALFPFVSQVLIVEPRASNPTKCDDIAAFLSGNDVSFRVFGADYSSVYDYLRQPSPQLAIIAGSIYLVGEFREKMLGSDIVYWKTCSTRSTR